MQQIYLYNCTLTLHDNVFFASREMGLLYETEKYLHNWALSYAIFNSIHIPSPYRLQGNAAQTPAYLDPSREQNLLHLNNHGIYVLPAKPIHWSYQINTFKAAQTTYYGKSKQFGGEGANKNYPINYGRAKELAVGSEYCVYIISQNQIKLPNWIRLGKWAAKIQIKFEKVSFDKIQEKSGTYICSHPLNPLDLPPEQQLLLYNRVVMPPCSLISQAQLEGDYWQIENGLCLPQMMAYGAGVSRNAE